MLGPFQDGHWTSGGGNRTFKDLVVGQRYVVVVSFTDYDGDVHPIGETWTFLGAAFVPYDDGQSLFVSLDGQQEWHIRLQWRADKQDEILEHFDSYVQPVDGN